MNSWLAVIPLLLGASFAGRMLSRQPQQETHCDADYQFGVRMQFRLSGGRTPPGADPKLILEESAGRRSESLATPAPQGGWEASRNLDAQPLFPFSRVRYFWQWAGGRTDECVLLYADDRYEWRSRTLGTVSVYWQAGDAAQAESAAELVRLTAEQVAQKFNRTWPVPVAVYWYPSLYGMHAGLGVLTSGYEGAVSDPASGVILLAAAEGIAGRRSVAILLPHETAHVVLGREGALLPLWFSEGISAGFEMEARPEWEQAFQEASIRGEFLRIGSLCDTFPTGTTAVSLAYAESRSFVHYLEGRFGTEGLRHAMESYQSGYGCREGFLRAFGFPLEEAERDWIRSLHGGENLPIPAVSLLVGAVILSGIALWARRRRLRTSHFVREDE